MPDVVETIWYWRYRADLVMLLVVADTVDQPVHPVPGVAVFPDRTWMVTVVPDGAETSLVRVSHPTDAPASMTPEVNVDDVAYGPVLIQSTLNGLLSTAGSMSIGLSLAIGVKAFVAFWAPSM